MILKQTQTEYDKTLQADILSRIEEMEQPSHPFPARFSARDYLLAALVALISLGMLIWGYYL